MIPFTTRQALIHGVSPYSIRKLVIGGQWIRVRKNAYLPSNTIEDMSSLLLTAGAVLPQLAGDPAISHESAATLWGLPHLEAPGPQVQLSRTRRAQGRCDYQDVIVHHAQILDDHVTTLYNLPVTTVARAILDITRLRGMRAGLVAAEAALKNIVESDTPLCSLADLRRTVADCGGWPQVRTARWVVENASPLSESPLESVSRAAFIKYQVPVPEQQVQIAEGLRVDFLWKDAKLVGEADGYGKYHKDQNAWRNEKAREQRLFARGLRVLRWGWDQAFCQPKQLCRQILEVLRPEQMTRPRCGEPKWQNWFLRRDQSWTCS